MFLLSDRYFRKKKKKKRKRKKKKRKKKEKKEKKKRSYSSRLLLIRRFLNICSSGFSWTFSRAWKFTFAGYFAELQRRMYEEATVHLSISTK